MVIAALVFPASIDLFELGSLTLDFLLVSLDLLILFRRLIFAPLQLIADERARSESKHRADCSARARMSNRRADNATRCGAAESADAGSLLASGQCSACAAGD